MAKNIVSLIFLKVQRFDNGDLGQSSGLWASSLAQNTDTALLWQLGMEHFYQNIIKKLLSFNATTLYQKVGGVAGGVSWVAVTMFRVHGGLRLTPELALEGSTGHGSGHSGLCRQEPSVAISGNLATPRRVNWQTRS